MFRLEITLSDVAMRDHEEVANALALLAVRLRGSDRDAGRVFDASGNTVGTWQFDTD